MTSPLVLPLLWLLAPAATPTEPARAPPAQAPLQTPFRLSLTFTHVLAQDQALTSPDLQMNAIGIDMAFPSGSYVRNHLGLANQWETGPGYSARGLAVDLISLGYPIELGRSTVRFDLEPVLTVLRGEIMFPQVGPTFFRLEGGFGLDFSATFRHWFAGVEPQIAFRYLTHSSARHADRLRPGLPGALLARSRVLTARAPTIAGNPAPRALSLRT